MAEKKIVNQVLTHTELYTLVIRAIDSEIDDWRKCGEGLSGVVQIMLKQTIQSLNEKRSLLLALYKIECGSDYE